MKSEGAYQKVLDEMQKQYDEFLLKKKKNNRCEKAWGISRAFCVFMKWVL